jgi:hypothetical protein
MDGAHDFDFITGNWRVTGASRSDWLTSMSGWHSKAGCSQKNPPRLRNIKND